MYKVIYMQEDRGWIMSGRTTFKKIFFMLLMEKVIPMRWVLSLFSSW